MTALPIVGVYDLYALSTITSAIRCRQRDAYFR